MCEGKCEGCEGKMQNDNKRITHEKRNPATEKRSTKTAKHFGTESAAMLHSQQTILITTVERRFTTAGQRFMTKKSKISA